LSRITLTAARLICTILLYVCVLDTIYGLVTKKIAVGNLGKIIVTPKEDNIFLYIIIYGVTIIFLKFPTAIFLVTRPYMVSRTHTTKSYRSTLRLSNSWQQHVRMEKLAENDLTYFYLRHVVIVVTAITTISLTPVNHSLKK
jgi:hypothetical protein